MHELGIMSGVMEAVDASAKQAGAESVLKISLLVGVMTEATEDALRFAFEALAPNTMSADAELVITMVQPRSSCLECGTEYEHDRLHMLCPECGSFAIRLLAGREMQIDSIEVDIPDDALEIETSTRSETDNSAGEGSRSDDAITDDSFLDNALEVENKGV